MIFNRNFLFRRINIYNHYYIDDLQGSSNSPFEKELNANDKENWSIEFIRKLARDVKTVTNGVMILSASAIGGELLFESEPVDTSVYSKVILTHLMLYVTSDRSFTFFMLSMNWPMFSLPIFICVGFAMFNTCRFVIYLYKKSLYPITSCYIKHFI